MPLVTLDKVDVEIAGARVLEGVTWTLDRGTHWGVVGANGAGKTTFLNLIAGTAWPAPNRGFRRYDFGRGSQTDAVEARREIVLVGHELQDRYARWGWNFSALDVVLSGVYRTDVPRRRPQAAERRRALEVMRRLGVAHLAERRFLELSRGEQRRVLIARGVAFDPAVLLLDEPASGLDRAARADLGTMLDRVAAERTLVGTAHESGDLPSVVDHVLRLERGRIVAAEPHEPGAPPAHGPPEIAAASAPLARESLREGPAVPLVDLERVDVWLGRRHVLANLTWRIEAGEQWLVTGPNGSGKSSLLRLLHGQLRPALGGRQSWPALGNPRDVWTLRRQVAWVSPELQAAYRYPVTVRACIASGFESSIGLTRVPSPAQLHRVDVLLAQLELTALADRPLASLSYGQARRALIARALANDPRLLLLDEPWEGLDADMAAMLDAALGKVIAGGAQLVCASHLAAHRERFTHQLVLDGGRVVYAGPRGAAP